MSELALYAGRDPRVARVWNTLEQGAASPPAYFLSWGWMENWIASLPPDSSPSLVVVHDGATPSAACFLGRRNMLRNLVVPSRALYLNGTGVSAQDELCIEHNGILRSPRSSLSLAGLIEMLPGTWDEVYFRAVDSALFTELAALDGGKYRVQIDREDPAPFVDLDLVRSTEGGYLALLSRTTRAQLRRARREVGALTTEVAADRTHAIDIYDELVRLHGQRWQLEGERGVFADPWFDQFHRRLIAQRLQHGEIQLMRIRAGAQTIGCLYNFVYRGRTLFYQSGLAQFSDPHIKPGFLCHAEAVAHNAALGISVYDFLGGASRYKQSLSTGTTQLMWLRVQRRLARFTVEDRLRAWKHGVAGWRQRRVTTNQPTRV